MRRIALVLVARVALGTSKKDTTMMPATIQLDTAQRFTADAIRKRIDAGGGTA